MSLLVAEDKAKELPQEQEKKPLFTQQKLCKDQRCFEAPSPERVDAPGGPQELPAFFSLAALAEVAAMENVHRYACSQGTPGSLGCDQCIYIPFFLFFHHLFTQL